MGATVWILMLYIIFMLWLITRKPPTRPRY